MRSILSAIVLVIANVSSVKVMAISNIEADKPRLPSEGFSGAVGLSLEGKKGNQDKEAYAGSGRFNFRRDEDLYLLLLAEDYGEKNQKRDDRSSFAHLRWTHLLSEKLATEVFVQRESEEFDYLKSRRLAGGGLRYFVGFKPDHYLCALGFGAFKEREINDLKTFIEEQNLWRLNSYYSLKLQVNSQLSLANTIYFQPNTEDFDDYRVLFDLSLSSKITERLAINLAYRLRHDSQPAHNFSIDPPIANHSTNTEYKSGISYSF